MERKIDKMNKEIQLLGEENRILKVSESRLHRELNATIEEKERFKQDYRELRQTNKTLEKDLRELDGKVKDVIAAKPPLGTREYSRDTRDIRDTREPREELSHFQQSGSKIKVLVI